MVLESPGLRVEASAAPSCLGASDVGLRGLGFRGQGLRLLGSALSD